MKRLVLFLLALLGVSCEQLLNGGKAEYGVPHVSFELKARVIDEQGNPIQGIEVSGVVDGVNDYYIPFDHKTGISNYLGEIDAQGAYFYNVPYIVRFEDLDGELNGGKFEALDVDITEFVEQTEEDSGSWYQGAYRADIGDVVMSLEEQVLTDE